MWFTILIKYKIFTDAGCFCRLLVFISFQINLRTDQPAALDLSYCSFVYGTA